MVVRTRKIWNKFFNTISFAYLTIKIFLINGIVYAGHFDGITDSSDVTEAAKPAAKNLATLAKYTGACILVWGAGELILSYMNDNPENKTRAIMKIMAGLFMILATELINIVSGGAISL